MPPLVHYKYPIIGHTYDYSTNSEEFLKQCRKEVRGFWDFVVLWIF
jgi:hypothetical protein